MAEESTEPKAVGLTPADLTRQRTDFLNEFFRGMPVLHGGTAVTILAFVQAAWDKLPPSFIRVVVVCMLLLVAGLVCSAVGQYGLYKISFHLQFGQEKLGRRWQRLHARLVWLSFAAFIVAVTIILGGLWWAAEFAGTAISKGMAPG